MIFDQAVLLYLTGMCTVLRKDAGRRKARVLDSGGIYQAVLLFPSSANSVSVVQQEWTL